LSAWDLKAARQLAVDAGASRASGLQILVATLDRPQATELLALFAMEPGQLRAGAEFLGSHGADDRDAEEQVVDLARTEAGRLGHADAGPEHLLLAIARRGDAVAAGMILSSVGLTGRGRWSSPPLPSSACCCWSAGTHGCSRCGRS
jgi:ATP-dependent Clp protease ATP-binding subunit ClpA